MALVVAAAPLLACATPRNLERLGLGRSALASLPLAQRVEGLRAATGEIAPYLRKRYGLPLVPTLDLDGVSAAGMTGGAALTWDGGPATRCADYLVRFTVAGGATTYQIDPYGGALGSTYGAAATFTGALTIDGYTLAIAGTINDGDAVGFSTAIVQDPGIALAVSRIAAWILLNSRGTDPKTDANLDNMYSAAIAWAKALGIPGEGELDPAADRTPTVSEYGPLGTGQASPYEWLPGGEEVTG
jgi:hypothetical protein